MADQYPKRRKLENNGFEYNVSVSNDTQQLNTIERNTHQIGHMLIALNAKLDAADARLNAKMDIILKKINDTDTKMEHIITKNTHLVYQLENVKKELSDLQIHMLHGHQMMIDNNADNNADDNADNNYNYCS
jgi:hypothetical protein